MLLVLLLLLVLFLLQDESEGGSVSSPGPSYITMDASGALVRSPRRQSVRDLYASSPVGLSGVMRPSGGTKDPARRRSIALRQLSAAQRHVERSPSHLRDPQPNRTRDLAHVFLKGKVG